MTKSDSAGELLFSKINTAGKRDTFRELTLAMKKKNASILITPNIHHLALLRTHPELREAYSKGAFILADGWPVAILASIKAKRIVVRQTGSDLITNIVRYNPNKVFRVALLGGFSDAALSAQKNLERRFAQIEVVYVNTCPAVQMEDLDFVRELRMQLSSCSPDLVILGLGCPKQELFSNSYLRDLPVGLVCNLGATIDFFAGVRSRAPMVVRLIGFEWLFRLLNEPGRLFGRYALGIRHFPYYFFRFISMTLLTTKE